MAVNVFWGISPNLLWILIFLAMPSSSSQLEHVDVNKPDMKKTSLTEIKTNIGVPKEPYRGDQILDYQEIRTTLKFDRNVMRSIKNKDVIKESISDPDSLNQFDTKFSSINNAKFPEQAYAVGNISISNKDFKKSDSFQSGVPNANGRIYQPLQESSLSSSQLSHSTSSKTYPKRYNHSLRARTSFSSIKDDENYLPISSNHGPTSPSPSTKTPDIPGVPYQPISLSPHDRPTERRTYTNGREIGSNEEMNVIYQNIETEKRASETVSGISSPSPRGTIQPYVDEDNENYIISPVRRTFSARLKTRGSEMEKLIRNKRGVNHENLTHFVRYDFKEKTRKRVSLQKNQTVTKRILNHHENVFQYNEVSQNIASQKFTNLINGISTPSTSLHSETSGVLSGDHQYYPPDTHYHTNFHHHHRQNIQHHRRRRRRRRQSTTNNGSSTRRRRPTSGQRSRSSIFGNKFRTRKPRPTTTNNRNNNSTGKPVSLKVVIHSTLNPHYERTLTGAIDSLMNSREYQVLGDYIKPSGTMVRLHNDMPKDILQAFCSDILRSNTTTVVHLMNPFLHRRNWESAGYVASLLTTVNVPRITWGPEYIGALDKKESDFSELNISPTLHHQARAIISLLAYYKWPYFAVLYTKIPGYDAFITSIKMAVDNLNNGINPDDIDNEELGRRFNSGSKRKNNDGSRRKQRVEHRIDLLTTVLVTNASSKEQTKDDLHYLMKTDARVIILFCKESQTIDLIEHSSKLGMMGKEYIWILSFEAINKNKLQNAGNFPVGLLGIQYSYQDAAMEQAMRTAARVWLEGFRQAVQSTAKLPGTPKGLPWELPTLQCQPNSTLEWKSGHQLYRLMKKSSFNDISFNDMGQLEGTNISIFNVQTVRGSRTRKKKWVEIGKWTKQGVFMKQITWPGGGTSPPSGKPERHFLRIVTREEPPFVEYRDLNSNGSCDIFSSPCSIYLRDANETRLSTNTTQKCCTGLSIEILRKLAAALDFEFKLYEVPDFQWGTKMSDGEWNGIVGELRAGNADMGVASMTIDEDKSGAVNFSVPYMETGITFIVAIREGAVSATAFLEPYDYPSWCLILVCSVHVTGASIFLFEWLSPDGMDHGKKKTSEHRFSLFRAFWLMWAMLFGAAVTTDSPRGVSSKFLSNIWALFALVFTASYTANLAAFMITKEEFYELSGMHDWRLQNPYSVNPPFRFATVPNGTAESNIKKNNPDMYNYMSKYSQISVEHAIEALKSQELHAFIYDASVLRYKEGKDEDCQLITVGNWYATTGYGVAFPLGSPWLEKVNKVILKLQYEGEMDRLKEFWLAGACHMKRKKSNNNKGIGNGVSSATLGILNFTSAFIFLLAGTGLAIIVFVMEFFFTWFGRKKLSSWSNKEWCHLISLSMGMTLSFRDSVREAMEAHRKAQAKQCKSMVCETKLWKAHFELKQARSEIGKLQNELDRLTLDQPEVDALSSNGVTEHCNKADAIDDSDDCTYGVAKMDSFPESTGGVSEHTQDDDDQASSEPHLAQVHTYNLNNGEVTKNTNTSDWPACLLNDDDDEEEEASVRVTLL